MQHILILGAGYAGLLAALRLQPQIKQGHARVTLVDASDTFTERIRLHQVASGQTLKQINIRDFLRGTGIEFIQDYVRRISPEDNRVTLDNNILDYDVLAVALGSHVNRDAVTGIYDYAYTLDRASAYDLNQRLQDGGRLLVIGGGLTGIEATTEFAERPDVEVQLVTHDVVGAELSQNGRDHIHQTLSKLGVTVHEHVKVNEIHADYADSSQGKLEFDVCLWAGGFKASPLAGLSGFATNSTGQMLVRDTLQSLDYDNVYGIGDAASIIMQNGNRLRMACAVAMPMGSHVADNISKHVNNQPLQPFQFSYALQCISLGRGNGLVQMLQADGSSKDQIFKGHLGTWIKEIICKYTIFSLQLEKRLPGSYWYPKSIPAVNQPNPVGNLA